MPQREIIITYAYSREKEKSKQDKMSSENKIPVTMKLPLNGHSVLILVAVSQLVYVSADKGTQPQISIVENIYLSIVNIQST